MDRTSRPDGVRFLLAFAGWASLAFLPAWLVSHPWQSALGAIASRVAAPRGTTLEMVDLELFYPVDLAVFVALVVASGWATWRRRRRALLVGAPLMIVAELVALCVALGVLVAANGAGGTEAGRDEAARLADALIRVTGLAIAGALWFALLGRERFLGKTR